MDRASPATVTTVMFCISTSSIKTRVHFFPTAGASSGHHSIACGLSLFGKGIEKRSVALDGGRLNQPDGVRLEDAFPALRGEATGVFGLQMHLSAPQGRVSLLSSQVAVELVSAQGSILYRSAPFSLEGEVGEGPTSAPVETPPPLAQRRTFLGVGLDDASLSTSLVMVNATEQIVRPSVWHGVGEDAESLPVGTISPLSAMEISLEESLFKGGSAHQCLWGLSRAEKISIAPESLTPQTAYYLMYRDPVSKRPISVCAL